MWVPTPCRFRNLLRGYIFAIIHPFYRKVSFSVRSTELADVDEYSFALNMSNNTLELKKKRFCAICTVCCRG